MPSSRALCFPVWPHEAAMQRRARVRRRCVSSAEHARIPRSPLTPCHYSHLLGVATLKVLPQLTSHVYQCTQLLVNPCQRGRLLSYVMASRMSCVGTRRADRRPRSVRILTPTHMAPILHPALALLTHSVQESTLTHPQPQNPPRTTSVCPCCGRCNHLNPA